MLLYHITISLQQQWVSIAQWLAACWAHMLKVGGVGLGGGSGTGGLGAMVDVDPWCKGWCSSILHGKDFHSACSVDADFTASTFWLALAQLTRGKSLQLTRGKACLGQRLGSSGCRLHQQKLALEGWHHHCCQCGKSWQKLQGSHSTSCSPVDHSHHCLDQKHPAGKQTQPTQLACTVNTFVFSLRFWFLPLNTVLAKIWPSQPEVCNSLP